MVLALKSSVRVAPLVMHGTGHILSRHGRSLTPGPVHIRALPPFDPAEHYELKERERMKSDLYATMNEAYVGLAKQQDLRDG
jgi:1-acyl-sn-glycerol-3-phosphate acyltransferase